MEDRDCGHLRIHSGRPKGDESVEETQGPMYRVGAQFTEQLNYVNPLAQTVETVWYNNDRYF